MGCKFVLDDLLVQSEVNIDYAFGLVLVFMITRPSPFHTFD